MRVCLGGTFEPLHDGHLALLRAAAQDATDLFVGVTDASLAQRKRPISPWQDRARGVEGALRHLGYTGSLTVRALADAMGPAASEPFDRIVVSPETAPGAERINAERQRRGLSPLHVLVVPHVLGEDLLPVSGTAVAQGRIDVHGRRLEPVRIAVGSANGVKVAAVQDESVRILGAPADVRGYPVPSGVPEQPEGDATLEGARNRAHAALAEWPEADYGIGIEAGIVRIAADTPVEAQACWVVDRTGWETHGWGPAFAYPAFVTERALRGEMVSSILGPIADDPRIGSTTGAIGWLTDGRLDRVALSRLAVLMAFVPRFRRGLYAAPPTGPGPAGNIRP